LFPQNRCLGLLVSSPLVPEIRLSRNDIFKALVLDLAFVCREDTSGESLADMNYLLLLLYSNGLPFIEFLTVLQVFVYLPGLSIQTESALLDCLGLTLVMFSRDSLIQR